MERIDISRPQTGEEEWRALREPLMSGWLTQGPQVPAFERAFAVRHKVPHALAASSCTTALHLILAGMDIGPGDEVIVPAFTWVASANAVEYCGARPVFADVELDTFNLDADSVAAKVTPRTRAVIAVHLFGLCADMERIARAAPGVPIVEDAACAAGAAWRGRPAGSIGYAAAFSFHPRKSITTGEGGMVTTADDALATKVASLRNHGGPAFDLLGYNFRMTDIQAAIGQVQLGKMDALIDERARWADYYRRELAGLRWLKTPAAPKDSRHGWQSYVCLVDEGRDALMKKLDEQGISTRYGTQAVHMLPYYRQRYALRDEDCPRSAEAARRSMAIPLHNRMSERDYARVVAALKGAR
jgi:dTDP-4-amino-4,6-dideoxygalactose transaminase